MFEDNNEMYDIDLSDLDDIEAKARMIVAGEDVDGAEGALTGILMLIAIENESLYDEARERLLHVMDSVIAENIIDTVEWPRKGVNGDG